MATYKSTIRSFQAAARAADRQAAARRRELERQQKQAAKLEAQERAAYEVAVYENHLEVLTSLHIDVGPQINWSEVVTSLPPPPPPPSTRHQAAAQEALDAHRPSKLMKRRSERERLELEEALRQATVLDEEATRSALRDHQAATEAHAEMIQIGRRILEGDVAAYQSVLDDMSELGELAEIGQQLSFAVLADGRVMATLDAHSDDVIPHEMKSLLASGKLSQKKMPVGRRWELYQDHVCSAALRAANDVFGLLPVQMVIVTVIDQILNTSTGLKEDKPILSVAIPRATLETLNLHAIDPSDAMSNFVHNMAFMKTKGFKPVDAIDPASLR